MRRFFKRRGSDRPEWHERRLDGPLRLPGSAYKHNKYTYFKEADAEQSASVPSCLSIFTWIYRHHAVLWARCQEEGRCTRKQLEAIEMVFVEGMSANTAAKTLGVSTQAICDRMNGLANRCRPIYLWWRGVTEGRRRRRSAGPRRSTRRRATRTRKVEGQ